MKLRYDGNHDAVETLDGQTVEQGKTADFPDALGARYREQSVWTEVDEDGNEVPQPVDDEDADDSNPDEDPEV